MAGPINAFAPRNDFSSLMNYGSPPLDYLNPLGSTIPGVTDAMPLAALDGVTGNTAGAPGLLDSLASWWGDFNGGDFMKGMVGTKEAPGWGGMALGVAQGLGSAYMGMQQYGLAKAAFDESKRQFNMNWNAQKKTVNSALEDRQRARVASNPGAYQSVGDYMKENGI